MYKKTIISIDADWIWLVIVQCLFEFHQEVSEFVDVVEV